MLHTSTLLPRAAWRDRYVPLLRSRIPLVVLQDWLCSVHAAAAFSHRPRRLCVVNLKLTMRFGIGSRAASVFASTPPGFLTGRARVLHGVVQEVGPLRGRGWGCCPVSFARKIGT